MAIDLAKIQSQLEEQEAEYSKLNPTEQYAKIPEGKHTVRIVKMEFANGKDSDKLMLRWHMKIISQVAQNRQLMRNNLLVSSQNLQWLKDDLYKCGLNLEKLTELPDKMQELVGLSIFVNVKHKGDNVNVYIDKLAETDEIGLYAPTTKAKNNGSARVEDDDIPF